jgi:hypothetical protein
VGLKVAVLSAPGAVGIALANWNWQVVRQFVEARCEDRFCRSACTRYLAPARLCLQAPQETPEQGRRGAVFFADEGHRPDTVLGVKRPAAWRGR